MNPSTVGDLVGVKVGAKVGFDVVGLSEGSEVVGENDGE